ncbi:MAG: DnaB-like helicase C-terminal domain-containing protein [Candidatus Anstonellales archaeon]
MVINIQSKLFSKFTEKKFLMSLLNVSLYTIQKSEYVKMIMSFIDDLSKAIRKGIVIPKQIRPESVIVILKIINSVISARLDIHISSITYNNIRSAVSEYIKSDPIIDSFISDVIMIRIKTDDEYYKEVEHVVTMIRIYNELKNINSSLRKMEEFITNIESDSITIFDLLVSYRDMIRDLYTNMDKLKTVAAEESLSDFLVISNDHESKDLLKEHFRRFFEVGYHYFKSGYRIIDNNSGGLESSTVHIISGPTNHGKSIFMINVLRNMMLNQGFSDKDCIVYITLEDDIYKLLKRLISIFGNIDISYVKELFSRMSSLFSKFGKATDNSIIDNFINVIYNKCFHDIESPKLILKHSTENTFSPMDASKFIEGIKSKGYNPKALFIDYIDVMIPSIGDKVVNDYQIHGIIVHELRVMSRRYRIPIFTITQNRRSSENVNEILDNSLVGDSYKKVRYTDYMYMVRQREDVDIESSIIREDLKGNESNIIGLKDSLDYLIPFEIKITKSKEGQRNISKFHIFNTRNLRIYDDIDSCRKDMLEIAKSTKSIKDLILMVDSISFDDIEDFTTNII